MSPRSCGILGKYVTRSLGVVFGTCVDGDSPNMLFFEFLGRLSETWAQATIPFRILTLVICIKSSTILLRMVLTGTHVIPRANNQGNSKRSVDVRWTAAMTPCCDKDHGTGVPGFGTCATQFNLPFR